MPQGPPVSGAAVRLLRWLLPLCLVAAAAVAGQGLFRVVGRPSAPPLSSGGPSLRLGSSPGMSPGDATSGSVPATSPSPRATSTGPPAPRTAAPEPVTRAVMVINASGITGLAGRTATLLRQRGVSVTAIGNLAPAQRPGLRTVYYPPGGRGQARTLAGLSGAPAVAPAPPWLGADGRLVLVVTDADTTSVRS